MKLTGFLFFFTMTCYGQQHYTIELNFKNSNGKKAYLTDAWASTDRNKATHTDSAYFINNKCTFKGFFKETMYYSIAVDSLSNFISFIIDSGKVVIEGDAQNFLFRSSLLSNSIQNELAKKAKRSVDSITGIRERFQDSMIKYQGISKEISLNYVKLMHETDGSLGKFLFDFTKTNPECFYTFFVLKNLYLISDVMQNHAEQIFPLFSKSIRTSAEGEHLNSLLFRDPQKLYLGKDMPVINSYDINGALKEIPIDANSTYLIDYWASWCIPCIANLPVIRDFKNRFEKKEFKIISISLDTKYNNWLAAIKKHNINWDNYCNLNGFNPSNIEIEKYLLSL